MDRETRATIEGIVEAYGDRRLQDDYDCCGCDEPWQLYGQLLVDLTLLTLGEEPILPQERAIDREAQERRAAQQQALREIARAEEEIEGWETFGYADPEDTLFPAPSPTQILGPRGLEDL